MNELQRVRQILFNELEALHKTTLEDQVKLKLQIAKGQATAKIGAEIIEAAKTELIGLKMLQDQASFPVPLQNLPPTEDVNPITGLSQTAYERAARIAAQKTGKWKQIHGGDKSDG